MSASTQATTPVPAGPGGQAAPLHKAILAQTRMELILTARRGESVLLMVVIPIGVLILGSFFANSHLVKLPGRHPIDFLLAGVLGLAVMSTSMVGLAIATGFERQRGVLKRLGASPLPRIGWLAAKVGSVLVVEAVQIVALLLVGLLLGWRPGADAGAAVLPLVLGTAAFSGIGLWMAGTLRAETTLGAANGLYLLLVAAGDMVFPIHHFPAAAGVLFNVLPAAALAESVRGVLSRGATSLPLGPLLILIAWAVVMPMVAARGFKWIEG